MDVEALHPEMFRLAVDVPFSFESLHIERTVDSNKSLVLVDIHDFDCASRIALSLAETLFQLVCVVEVLVSEAEDRSALLVLSRLRERSSDMVLCRVLFPEIFERLGVERTRDDVNAVLCRHFREVHLSERREPAVFEDLRLSVTELVPLFLDRHALAEHVVDYLLVREVFFVQVKDPGLIITCAVAVASSASDEAERAVESLTRYKLFSDVLHDSEADLLIVSLVETDVSANVEGIAESLDLVFFLVEVFERRNEVVLDAATVHVAVIVWIRLAVNHRIVRLTTEKLEVIAVAGLFELEKLADNCEIVYFSHLVSPSLKLQIEYRIFSRVCKPYF